LYREFWFENYSDAIQASEMSKVAEIATYMKKNPSLQVGIDGSMDSRGTDLQGQNLCDRRARAIRDALVEAGVSSRQISAGAYGDVGLRRNGRVEVLIASAN
jgi:outer membrane protein OmpA-like peptidoglycan-associated protein